MDTPVAKRIFPLSEGSPESENYRTDAIVDRDRIWYSSEFRRLGGVTQVVPPQSDFLFHDRLTHSIKVAQVAESIAKYLTSAPLGEDLAAEDLEIGDWIDPVYCYLAGLAHDIGHPPFGHAGEFTIQRLLGKTNSDYLRQRSFEGNAQSTRIVSTLSFRKMLDQEGHLEGGLNPTLRSVAAIAKYPWLRGNHPQPVPKLRKKWSFYPEEEWILNDLVAEGYIAIESEQVKPPRGRRRRIDHRDVKITAVHRWPEAEIMDWADDISYAVHDVEDFYRAGRLPLHAISVALGRADSATDWASIDFATLTDDVETSRALAFCYSRMAAMLDRDGNSMDYLVPQAFSRLYLGYAHFWPKSPFDGSRASHVSLQKFASEIITDFIEAASIQIITVNTKKRVAVLVNPIDQLVAEFFKSLCQYYVIRTSNLSTMQVGQSVIVDGLYEDLHRICVEWIKEFHSDVGNVDRRLPARLREYLIEALGNETNLSDEQIFADASVAVIDYLCSLRDQQAYLIAARLSGDQGVNWSGTWIDG